MPTIQFGISAQEEKLQDANQKATQAAEQVRQLLRSNGIDPSEAQISRFATQPVYDYKNAKRKLVGYRVDANISIKVKDFSKIGPISEGLANMKVTDTSITYQIDNIDAAKIKAVQDALRRAHEEANAVAQAGGFAENDSSPPVMEFVSSGEGLQLSLAFMKIKDPKLRKRVLDLVKQMAEDEDDK